MSLLFVRPVSIAEVAAEFHAEPLVPFWKPLCEFLDEFYERDGDASMLSEEPVSPINREDAAYLAGVAEYLSLHYALVPPDWCFKPRYFLETAYHPGPWRSPVVDAMCAIESPFAFRRRLVFVDAYPLRRKLGPKTVEEALHSYYLAG